MHAHEPERPSGESRQRVPGVARRAGMWRQGLMLDSSFSGWQRLHEVLLDELRAVGRLIPSTRDLRRGTFH